MSNPRMTMSTTAATLALLLLAAPAAIGAGHANPVSDFDAESGELPEGVVVAADGTVYASLSQLGQLVRLGADDAEVVGTIDGLGEGDFGLIGITEAPDGSIYGGVFSATPEATGVWRFDVASGSAERVAGSEEIALANDVAFGADGTMYITDTITGAVWHVPPDGELAPWLVDPLLAGTGEAGFPFPVGANGIDVHDGTVYVGVTETAQVVTIPIAEDGTAGAASALADYPAPIDGVEVADDGTVYATHPFANLVTSLAPGGEIEVVAEAGDGLDAPSSVDVYTDADGDTTLYVANFSVAMGGPMGAGPSILAIDR